MTGAASWPSLSFKRQLFSSSLRKRKTRRRGTMGPFLPFVLLVLLFLLSQVVIIAVMAAQDTNKDDPVSRDGQQEEMMPLSPPQTSEGNSHTLPQLKFGEKMRFDDMGPVIVNKDGTTRRITNWQKMTKWEQERTLARIAKRNKERMDELTGGASPSHDAHATDEHHPEREKQKVIVEEL